MKAFTLSSIVRRLASTLARKHGITVEFRGKTAMTSGRHITLPALVAGSTLTKREADEFFGYLDHEVSHILHSCFVTVEVAANLGEIYKHILNLFEDVRVENLFMADYPGSVVGLNAVCDKLEAEYKSELNVRGEELGVLNLVKVVQMLYEHAYTFRDRATIRSESLADFPELLPMIPLVERGVKATTTKGALVQSEAVVEILKKLFPQSAPEMDKKPDASTAGKGTAPDSDDSLGEAMAYLAAVLGKGGGAGAVLAAINQVEAKADAKRGPLVKVNGRKQKGGDKIVPPCSVADDKVFYHPGEDLATYQRVLAAVSYEAAMLKKALHIFLKSRASASYERGMDRGSLDSQSVWKISVGDYERIFKEKRVVSVVDTACCAMIDLSGSMNLGTTQMAAVLCSEALMGVPKVKLAICGFTTGGYVHPGAGGRAVPLLIPMFKDFDDDGRKARGRIGALRTASYTPLGEAFAHGYETLLGRKESRRVLWLITDGEPSFPSNDSEHNEFLLMARIKEKCQRAGIVVVGLELGHSGRGVLAPYSDVSVYVESSTTLPTAVLEMVKELVTLKRG